MASAALLRLELFGRPALSRGREEVSLSPMQWALVALVFGSAGGRGTRTELVHKLWDGVEESTGLKRLSQLIYEVEQRAGGPVFLKTGLTVRPDRLHVRCDVEDFEEALEADDLGQAARRLVDGFLEGIPEVPTDRFDRWIDQRIASLRANMRSRATKRWSRAEDEGVWNQRTIDAANALLYLSPASEAALRRSVWAQAMAGSPLEAIATLEGFVETNGLEGSQELDNETLTLLERVRALSRHRKGSHIERPRPSRADPTLYGREQELARLRPLLAGPIEDGITVVAVGGEAGLGKSRLVRECLEPAMLQGRLILRTTLSELERDIPLNALIEAMATQDVARAVLGLEEPWRSVILSLMPRFVEVAGAPAALPYVQPASLQRRLLESVRLLMDEVVGHQPILLFIDDFHWADDSSLAALEYVRRRWSTGSMVLVVAYRPEHVVPGSPVARFLEADSVESLPLGPLAEVARKQLVKEAAGGDVPEAVVNGLKELGGGNPLFLIELARQWADGELELPTRHVDRIQLPVSLQQLFERRLVGFDATTTRVLEALSVLAKRTPMSVIQAVSGLSQAEVADGLEALDRSRLLRWDDSGAYLWHGLLRQVVLAKTSEARLRWLHGNVADSLLTGGSAAGSDELALHLDRAFRRAQARLHALNAADQAEELGALPEAAFFLELAAKNASAPEVGSIRLRLADLWYRAGRFVEAWPAYESALAPSDLASPDALLGAARRLFAGIEAGQVAEAAAVGEISSLLRASHREGVWEAYATVLRAAIHRAGRSGDKRAAAELLRLAGECSQVEEPRARCMALQLELLRRIYLSEPWAGSAASLEALEIAEVNELDDLIPGALKVAVTSTLLDGALETPAGLELQSRAVSLAARYGDIVSRFRISINLGAFYLDIGEWDTAEGHIARAQYFHDMGGTVRESKLISVNRGELSLARGEPAQAASHFLRAREEARTTGSDDWAAIHAGLALCEIEQGRLKAAESHLDVLDSELGPDPTLPVDFRMVAWARARMAVANNRLPKALDTLERAEHQAKGVHVPYWLGLRLRRLILMRRYAMVSNKALFEEAEKCCQTLNLSRRSAQLGRLAH